MKTIADLNPQQIIDAMKATALHVDHWVWLDDGPDDVVQIRCRVRGNEFEWRTCGVRDVRSSASQCLALIRGKQITARTPHNIVLP